MVQRGYGRGGKNSTGALALNHFQRELAALEMRLAGLSDTEIARRLGYKHPNSIRRLVIKAMHLTREETANAVRRMELARLDKLQNAAWSMAMDGSLSAIDTVLRVMKHRATILGLNAPIKVAKTDSKGRDVHHLSDQQRADRILKIMEEAAKKRAQAGVQVELVGVPYHEVETPNQ